jgi:hypothetical protein
MDEWQAQQIREFLQRNPDARAAAERKLLGPCGTCGVSEPMECWACGRDQAGCDETCSGEGALCPHGKRWTQECLRCDDAAEIDEGFPVGSMRDGMRGFRGGKPND